MSGPGLTPNMLRQQHVAAITKSDTFEPQGISEQTARDYLDTDEGALYWYRLAEADPSASSSIIDDRALEQITSGRELPRMETLETGEPLVKIVPAGILPSDHSPFWTKAAELDAAVRSGKNLSEHFGLPIMSEAPRYDVYRITPQVRTQVFLSTVAPTFELNGLVTKTGGAEQSLVPNRQLFTDPVYLRSIDNTLELSVDVGRASLLPNLGAGTLAVVGMAATAYDAGDAVHCTAELLHQGNVTGAQSGLLHLGGRTLGMVAGAEALGALGTLAGAESGPGMMVTGAIGGVAGAFGGEQLMDAVDQYRIYHQRDPQGLPWRYDPDHPEQRWVTDLPPLPGGVQPPVADEALQNRLDYQASGKLAELRMATPGELADPYRQPAGPNDPDRVQASDWTRDAQSHAWTRSVITEVVDRVTLRANETASPERAAELDRAAEQTVLHNRMNSPQGVAAAYLAMHEQRGWARVGPVPDAVTANLRDLDRTVMASNGHTYTRDAEGQWSTPGLIYGRNTAEGAVRDELELTRRLERAAPSLQPRSETPVAEPSRPAEAKPFLPAAPTRLDDPGHPDHAFFQQNRGHIHALDRSLGRTPDLHSDQIASMLTVQARADGLQRIDRVALSDDGSKLWAVQTAPGMRSGVLDQRTSVPTTSANRPMEHSGAQWPQAMQQFDQIQHAKQGQSHAFVQARDHSQQQLPQAMTMER